MTKRRAVIDTRTLCGLAVLAGLSVVSMTVIRFSIFPAVAHLEYDIADVFMLIATFIYGPFYGVVLCAIASVLQGIIFSASSGIWGIVMHFVSTSSCLVIAGVIYHRKKTIVRAAVGITLGVICWTLVMIPLNLLITPLAFGAPVNVVWSLMGWIVLFNAIKAGGNGLITFLIYKRMHALFRRLSLSAPAEVKIDLDCGDEFSLTSRSAEETRRIGSALARNFSGKETVLLSGELGAGKTVLTKGIADTLGIEEEIVSPTFNIVREYHGIHPLYHFDMYRVSEEECAETGISEHLGEGVCVIEWNKFSKLYGDVIVVNIEYAGKNKRNIVIKRRKGE